MISVTFVFFVLFFLGGGHSPDLRWLSGRLPFPEKVLLHSLHKSRRSITRFKFSHFSAGLISDYTHSRRTTKFMLMPLNSILFLFLVLTAWTIALPAPRSHELAAPLEVRGDHEELAGRIVEEGGLGTRTVEEEEEGQLVRRLKIRPVKVKPVKIKANPKAKAGFLKFLSIVGGGG